MSTVQDTRIQQRNPSTHESGTDTSNRWLAAGGVVGPILLVVAFTVAGLVRPGYCPVHQAVSDLGVGPNPWILNFALVALGVLLTAFVVGFNRTVGQSFGTFGRWSSTVLLALPGLGFAWAAIFTEAPATLTLHWVVGMPLLALGSIVGFMVTGIQLRRLMAWAGWSTYSIVSSIATLAMVAFMFSTWRLGFGGITERVLFIVVLAWYVAVGWRLSRQEAPVRSAA